VFEKPESQLDQITNVQNTFVNQHTGSKKSDNIDETEDNFWADVENSEILPPESFQNESLQLAMNNLQISNEVSKLWFIILEFIIYSKINIFKKYL